MGNYKKEPYPVRVVNEGFINKTYKVKIVEDSTSSSLNKKQVLLVVLSALAIYLIFEFANLYSSINEGNFWDVFSSSFKELIYSTSFSFLVFIVSNIDFTKKKKYNNK